MLPLLNVLVCSTTDKFSDDVAARSRGALSRFSDQRLITGARPLIDTLEENVFNLATQLPNQMSVPGESLHVYLCLTGLLFCCCPGWARHSLANRHSCLDSS